MHDFCAFVLKEIYFPKKLAEVRRDGSCKRGQHSRQVACSHQPGLPSARGHLQPARLWVCPTPVAETATTGGLCVLRKIERLKKLYAYSPKSHASCDQPWLSQNFFIAHGHARFTSIRGEEH
ncbi:hypothetical protein ACRRTK_020398 [Alexandromys fortis]